MCFFVESHHNCGHQHGRFARCLFAERDSINACNEPSFPVWKHEDPLPCPDCHAHRKAHTNELLSSKGGKSSGATHIKKKTQSNARSSRQSTEQSFQQQPEAQPVQHIAGEYDNIGDQLHTLADNDPRTSPLPAQAVSPPWVPPSRRYASIVGQLGSSPPPRSQTHEITSPHSPKMLECKDTSRPDSAMASACPEGVQTGSPQLAWLAE
jgi:hypothetical protein